MSGPDLPTLHDMIPDKPSEWSIIARAAGKARCKTAMYAAREEKITSAMRITVEASGLRGSSVYTRTGDFLDRWARDLHAVDRRPGA